MMNQQTPSTNGNAEASERLLLDLVASGDRAAFSELFRRYHAKLFKFVYRLSRSYSAADELVNDIMLAVWRSAGTFRGESRPSTWIFGIAYRQTLKRLSKKQLSLAPSEPDEHADNRTRNIEHEDWIQKGLESLSPAQRLAVELVFYLGLSYEEVATVTECPVNTVKTRMFHARHKLKEQLEKSAQGKLANGGDL